MWKQYGAVNSVVGSFVRNSRLRWYDMIELIPLFVQSDGRHFNRQNHVRFTFESWSGDDCDQNSVCTCCAYCFEMALPCFAEH
jgi:hypothetical protein